MSRNPPQQDRQPSIEDPLDEVLIRNGLAEIVPPRRGWVKSSGTGQGRDPQQQGSLVDDLDELVIRSGLAELAPLKRRGRAPLILKLALLLLALVSLIGLPLGGVLLCLVLAVVIEAANDSRRRHVSWLAALARPAFWERFRAPLYWTTVVGIGLVALLIAREALLLVLLRVGVQWLSFRGIRDFVRHPERYRSVPAFVDWLDRLGLHVDRAWSVGLSSVILSITAGFVINLVAPGIWASVGNTSWDRLLVAGGGLYLIAVITFLRSSSSTARSTLQEGMQDWEEPEASDLESALVLRAGLDGGHAAPAQVHQAARRIAGQLAWKQVDSLVARVRPKLEHSLAQQLRWGAFVASVMAFLLAFFFLAAAVFLIVPRDVIAGWVSAGGTGEHEIVLAVDGLEQLLSLDFVNQLLDLDWPSVSQEPIPKVAFLEAAVLAALMLLRASTDRSALGRMADADASSVRRRLLRGTAYLLLLEEGFQYLYSGLATRQVTDAGTIRTTTVQNEVLLVPSVATKAGTYQAISNFHRLYESPEPRTPTTFVTVFASHRLAHEWATRFVRFPSLAQDQPVDLAQMASFEPDVGPRKYWIWSGGQVVDLESLEEAQWYGRFTAR
jgi:hypothetical protein